MNPDALGNVWSHKNANYNVFLWKIWGHSKTTKERVRNLESISAGLCEKLLLHGASVYLPSYQDNIFFFVVTISLLATYTKRKVKVTPRLILKLVNTHMFTLPLYMALSWRDTCGLPLYQCTVRWDTFNMVRCGYRGVWRHYNLAVLHSLIIKHTRRLTRERDVLAEATLLKVKDHTFGYHWDSRLCSQNCLLHQRSYT